ncbi:MAG: stage II sporulation protein M [Candidatus Aenigmarchaeota archaeon]|nr:stage II sporulation protein M [Candidatus Aenigmarchaeota archaeon]
MVFELLMNAKEAESKPIEMFFYGLLITTVSLFAAYYIFPSSSSVIFLFLITIAAFPTISAILRDDEDIDEETERIDLGFFAHHEKTIMVYAYLFMGVLIGVSFWYTILPDSYTSTLFSQQANTIASIRLSGSATASTMTFWAILSNNLKVTTIAFLMSFFFGTGAIFILSWNASVIGVFVSGLAGELSHKYSYSLAQGHLDALLSISIHGVPEIVAYFFAGIAGGILSIGMIRGKHDVRVMKDAGMLYLVSSLILVAAAVLEVWVTPNL